MNLSADARIDALQELLGEQERQRGALHLRVHDLERIQGECVDTIRDLAALLDSARGRSAAMEAVMPLLLEASDPKTRDRAQAELELRWRQDLAKGTGMTARYASAFETVALQLAPQSALPR